MVIFLLKAASSLHQQLVRKTIAFFFCKSVSYMSSHDNSEWVFHFCKAASSPWPTACEWQCVCHYPTWHLSHLTHPITNSKWVSLSILSARKYHHILPLDQQGVSIIASFLSCCVMISHQPTACKHHCPFVCPKISSHIILWQIESEWLSPVSSHLTWCDWKQVSDSSLFVLPGSLIHIVILWKRVSNTAISLSCAVSSLLIIQSTASEWCSFFSTSQFLIQWLSASEWLYTFHCVAASWHHIPWPTDCQWLYPCFARHSHYILCHGQQEVSNTAPFFAWQSHHIISSHSMLSDAAPFLVQADSSYISSLYQQRVSAMALFSAIHHITWPTASE